MKNDLPRFVTALILRASLGLATVVHAELPAITGNQLSASINEIKLAFLMGLATMVKTEQKLIGDPPPPGTVCFAPALAKGIGDMTWSIKAI